MSARKPTPVVVDPEAPWGRRKDGLPKKRPGRIPKHPNVDRSPGPGAPWGRKKDGTPRKHCGKWCPHPLSAKERKNIRTKQRYWANIEESRAKACDGAKRRYQKNPDKFRNKAKEWAATHPEKIKANNKRQYWKDPEKRRAQARIDSKKRREAPGALEERRAWQALPSSRQRAKETQKRLEERNPGIHRKYGREWYKNNTGRALFLLNKRRAAKLRATPSWVDDKPIAEIYAEADRQTELTGIHHVVDHIVPLQGNGVCGLHVSWNLQILTKSENSSKSHFLIESLAVAPTRANGLLDD